MFLEVFHFLLKSYILDRQPDIFSQAIASNLLMFLLRTREDIYGCIVAGRVEQNLSQLHREGKKTPSFGEDSGKWLYLMTITTEPAQNKKII